MISVVIATLNDERRLGRTLGALVQAAVDGLVHEVIIADGGSTDATLEVADDAGAVMVAGDLAAGCAAAREPWLLILDAGAVLQPGWEPLAHAHTQATPQHAGCIEPTRPGGLGGWLAAIGRGRPVVGLLTPKALADGGYATLDGLARSIGRARLTRLDLKAMVEP